MEMLPFSFTAAILLFFQVESLVFDHNEQKSM